MNIVLEAEAIVCQTMVWCDIKETAAPRMSYLGQILDVNHSNILGMGIIKVKIWETHLFIETSIDKQRKTKERKLKFFDRSCVTICGKLNTNRLQHQGNDVFYRIT